MYLSGRRACLICMKSFMGSSVLHKVGMVIHSCNLSSQEVETGVLDVQGPPGLHEKIPQIKHVDGGVCMCACIHTHAEAMDIVGCLSHGSPPYCLLDTRSHRVSLAGLALTM